MTQEEILEGNKLIAEFMGGEYTESSANNIAFARLKEWRLAGIIHDQSLSLKTTEYLAEEIRGRALLKKMIKPLEM